MKPAFVAFPGSIFSSKSHYGVFMRGNTPLTAKLLKPALIDAATGKLTDTRNLPWYVTALLISQPLHFGDYGGMPLKIIWAALDALTIIVIGSGLYLWFARRGRKTHAAAAVPKGGWRFPRDDCFVQSISPRYRRVRRTHCHRRSDARRPVGRAAVR